MPKTHDLPDDPVIIEDETPEPVQEPKAAKRTRIYIFPDIDGDGPAVKIEATSIEEATALFQKGHA